MIASAHAPVPESSIQGVPAAAAEGALLLST